MRMLPKYVVPNIKHKYEVIFFIAYLHVSCVYQTKNIPARKSRHVNVIMSLFFKQDSCCHISKH